MIYQPIIKEKNYFFYGVYVLPSSIKGQSAILKNRPDSLIERRRLFCVGMLLTGGILRLYVRNPPDPFIRSIAIPYIPAA